MRRESERERARVRRRGADHVVSVALDHARRGADEKVVNEHLGRAVAPREVVCRVHRCIGRLQVHGADTPQLRAVVRLSQYSVNVDASVVPLAVIGDVKVRQLRVTEAR
eukprot:254711-Pleurochrysis_carterae.AAC.1